MYPYKVGISKISENKKEISFAMKGVAFHDKLLGRWTEPAFIVESSLTYGLLMEKGISRRPDKGLLYYLLTIDGVISIELKKKSFIVEVAPGTNWPPILEEIVHETMEFLYTKTFLKRRRLIQMG